MGLNGSFTEFGSQHGRKISFFNENKNSFTRFLGHYITLFVTLEASSTSFNVAIALNFCCYYRIIIINYRSLLMYQRQWLIDFVLIIIKNHETITVPDAKKS